MARPRKERAAKKTGVVKFRVSDSQRQLFDQIAFDADLTLSDLIISRILGEAPKRKKASPERASLIRRLNDLSSIRSNINQIARALNSGYGHNLPDNAIADSLFEVTRLSNRIFEEFDKGE
jgi:hypothetical protein